MLNQLSKECFRVCPKLIQPQCYKYGIEQDCTICTKYKIICISPMSMCVRPYHGHRKGCPNYGKKDDCSPNMPFFPELFDISEPVWAIATSYDLKSHIDQMRVKHPSWTEHQLRCLLYWQNGARRMHKEYISNIYKQRFQSENYYISDSPEAMGMDMGETVGNRIRLEWPCQSITYKISIVGKLLPHIKSGTMIRGKVIEIKNDGYVVCRNVKH